MYVGVPTSAPKTGVDRSFGQLLANRLGDTEVDDLWNRDFIMQGNKHVARLNVAMDDAFHVGMLDRLADGNKHFKSLLRSKFTSIAELGDRKSL